MYSIVRKVVLECNGDPCFQNIQDKNGESERMRESVSERVSE